MPAEIIQTLEDSIIDFIKNNKILLDNDLSERNICSELRATIKKHFSDWDVDTEYNRFGKDRKRKLIIRAKERFLEAKRNGETPNSSVSIDELYENPESAPVYPDLIVHERTEEFNNLIVLEVKKSNNPELLSGWDEWKIEFFRNTLRYQIGAHLVLNTGRNFDDPNSYIEKLRIWT